MTKARKSTRKPKYDPAWSLRLYVAGQSPKSIAALSGGGALGSGRLHGVPQLMECYLQLAGRAGERQREATNAVFSYSAPYFGGCAALTNDPA